MGAARLLDSEVRYVDADGVHVDTSVATVDAARLMTALPVRRIRSHAGQRHRPGLFWSATTRGHVPYESRLELDRLWLADFDPAVSWIAAQPMLLSGRSDVAAGCGVAAAGCLVSVVGLRPGLRLWLDGQVWSGGRVAR